MKFQPLASQRSKPLTQSTMNITRRRILLARMMSAFCLAACAAAPRAAAQPQPSLGLQFSGGQPTLSLTGTVGTVYSIQYSTDLSPTGQWIDRTLVKAQAGSNVWSDPSAPTPGQRFYRAVSVPVPADTNLVFIPPGMFTMGSPTNEVDRDPSEDPQTTVTISRGFWMGKYEVTQWEYWSVMGNNPSSFTASLKHPVESVTWSDATNYCAKLTQRERVAGRIATNSVYRLPTEAEWEYACRAGTTTRFSHGDDPGYTNLTSYAWYTGNAAEMTHAVGQKLPNPWGLYDMHGNVWEWCQDWHGAYPGGSVIDPQGPLSGTDHIFRGGGWFHSAKRSRSAQRFIGAPEESYDGLGFRVVLALVQP
jgi:formylglycine-generating enzyme required for sulfatase activity